MKKQIVKAAFAVVLVAVAGVGAWKSSSAYNGSHSESDLLMAENVEALSDGYETEKVHYGCKDGVVAGKWTCTWYNNGASCTGCKQPD